MALFGSITKTISKVTSVATKAAKVYAKASSGAGLASLAYEHLGKSTQFKELASFNNLNIFKQITQGQAIRLPSENELKDLAVKVGRDQLTKAVKNIESDLLDVVGQRVNSCLSGEISDKIAEGKAGLEKSVIDWLYVKLFFIMSGLTYLHVSIQLQAYLC